nr:MAG TPA: hypothetical protein [Caudoviricetes sp.]
MLRILSPCHFVIAITLNHTRTVDRVFYNMYIVLKRKHG